MTHLVKSIYLRNLDSVSKKHILGMYVYVMEAYTIKMSILFPDFLLINLIRISGFPDQLI